MKALRCLNCLVLMLAIPFLVGCGEPKWHEGIDEYRVRLARVLGIEVAPFTWERGVVSYPKRRALLVEEPKAEIGLIEFMRLSKCDLQRLVGEHNGSLARFQAGSQLLFYQADFIRLAEHCIESDAASPSLLGQIEVVLQQKKKAKGAYIWNASFSSLEFQKLYSPVGEMNPAHASSVPATIEQAVNSLSVIHRQFLVGTLESSLMPGYESALAVLGSSNYAGALLRQQSQLALVLAQLAEQLKVVALCRVGSNGAVLLSAQKRDALLHVFQRFYIEEVQAVMANLVRQRKQWEILQADLTNGLPLPIAAQNYFERWARVSGDLDSQIAWHTKFWQRELARCGLAPGAAGE